MRGWDSSFFSANRKKLAKQIDGGLVVLSSYVALQRRSDMAHSFSQEPNMWYLSGIDEPTWRLIYDSARDHTWLVRPEIGDTARIFDGGLSDDEALDISGADDVVSWSEQERILRQLSRKHSAVYAIDPKRAASGLDFVVNPASADTQAMLQRIFQTVIDVTPELQQQRAIKSEPEIAAIQRAVDLTVKSFQQVRQKLPTLAYEYEIEAEFSYAFRRHGARHAYDPIVASGKRACTLHYVKNSAKRQPRSAVLIDIGAELDGYCADITRTYAWGKPTKRLVELHQALEGAQVEIIDSIVPYMPVADYQRMVDTVMKRYMVEVKLLDSENDGRYREYFPHAISHGLGIDVHDSLGGARTLEPGMVLTVEPGFYLSELGLGLRIEDDILITKSGVTNLSAELSTSLSD